MPSFDVAVHVDVSRSGRSRQLETLFDVPPKDKQTIEWHVDMPIETKPWQVGLIVGSSGSGKTVIAKHLYGDIEVPLKWDGKAVIDDFDDSLTIQEIVAACSAVGFNTIPAWLRPFRVLSNGEQFRATLARRLIEAKNKLVVMDEFTSVVDRQVAKIGAHAVAKYIRKDPTRQFVAVSCHDDIVDWLQPDWMYCPATNEFTWRELRRRPNLDITICAIPYAGWRLFAPFHYLTAELGKHAQCFALFVAGNIAALAAIMRRPHPKAKDIMGCSRLVTLPDWQGLGLAFVLIDKVASCYKTIGERVNCYPAHPALVQAYNKSTVWKETQRYMSRLTRPPTWKTATVAMGARPCGVYTYVGDAATRDDADAIFRGMRRLKVKAKK